MSTPEKQASDRAYGIGMMVVGGLLASLCGTCTLNVMLTDREFGGLALLFGGAPIVLGLWFFFLGLKSFRGSQKS